MTEATLWWQTGTVYQIYPRSFMDSNGDGTGDLKGIASKLDYLAWLDIDAIWLSPIFPSPMADFGYDVADYVNVDPLFGTLADFDALLEQAHARGIKVLLDLVPNHSSDEHPWFVESRSSRDNPKRDWYIWRDPAPDGGPPNNWESFFGGGAWEFDSTTGQYYLHLFHAKQPDLNWRNPEVRRAIYDAMRFWLDRGVDGFRVDVIWLMIKDEQFRDNPPNPDWKEGDPPWTRFHKIYTEDQPEVHQVVREMRTLLDEYDERVMIGEIYLPVPRLMTYYGESLDEAHLPFNFQLVLLPWHAPTIRQAVDEYEAALPERAWPNWVLGNHDQHRVASRIGAQQARVAQMLLLTLRGTPTCYYGDEIGMHDVPIPPELAHDPQEHLSPGYGRDPERTPMQWDATPNAGFSSATPWLPVADDYASNNVAAQRDDPRSMLSLFRRLIELRRSSPALTLGAYRSLDAGSDEVFAYLRESAGQRLLIVLNLGSSDQTLDLAAAGVQADLLCSTHLDRSERVDLAQLKLRPDEGLLLSLL
jgi:alpha-glucosidase